MGPGLVRRGRLLHQEPGAFAAAFRSDEPHYLAVGSRVTIAGDKRGPQAVVVRRSERERERVYVFFDAPVGAEVGHETASSPRKPFARAVEVSFGKIALRVAALWIGELRIGLAVTLDDEQRLAAADFVELRVPVREGEPPARICGWIRERVLAMNRVAYTLECAPSTGERPDDEWLRIVAASERDALELKAPGDIVPPSASP